jgi:N utilization substance protein A
VVEWNADTSQFIGNALSPAKVRYVVLGNQPSDSKTATVVVPDDQLSLAIGKEGQNARLAAKLTGWRIDIKSMSEAKGEELRPDALTLATSKERDILAMAEAILLGKAAPQDGQAAEPEAVPEPEAAPAQTAEAELEVAPAQEIESAEQEVELVVPAEGEPEPSVEPSLLEQAQELLRDEAVSATADDGAGVQEPEPEMAPVAEAAPEPVSQVEAEAEVELEAAPEAVAEQAEPLQEPEAVLAVQDDEDEDAQEPSEEEQEPEAQPERVILRRSTGAPKARPQRTRRPRFQYVRDERLEALDQPEKGKDSRRKRRKRLVVDEETGELVSRPRHKREDEQEEWDGSS